MTTDDARAKLAEYQDRCLQMGERNGESQRLGAVISIALSLCGELDARDAVVPEPPPAPDPVPVVKVEQDTTPPRLDE